MKNTFGTNVCVTLFGESHGPAVGAVLDGLAPGIEVNGEEIAAALSRRRPAGDISTARREPDRFEILSGVYRGRTTGAPVCVLIPNTDVKSDDYEPSLPRPGHADLTAHLRYGGWEDPRGGGHFSGRLTAALTAVGAIAAGALGGRGVLIGTHVLRCAGIADAGFTDPAKETPLLHENTFPVLDEAAGEKMREAIRLAAAAQDSVGGVLETVVTGLPAGVGEPWFDTVEGVLSHALFSVPAVKGVEFGAGFAFADMRGSEANDPIAFENGAFITKTNNNGGVNGGLTNGMPLIFRCCIKPTPSIGLPQETADLQTGEPARLCVAGRHDPAILHRAAVVTESVAALALCDLLALRFGADWLRGD